MSGDGLLCVLTARCATVLFAMSDALAILGVIDLGINNLWLEIDNLL